MMQSSEFAMEGGGAAATTGPMRRAPERTAKSYSAPSNPAMLAFLTVTLLAIMLVDQVTVVTPAFFAYWLLVLPMVLLPLTNLTSLVQTAFSWPASLLLILLFTAGCWHIMSGDSRAAVRLVPIVLMLVWLSGPAARVRDVDVIALYLIAILVGAGVYAFTDFNQWGLLPGSTAPEYGIWRISFTPNIAYSGFFSLAVLLIASRDWPTLRRHRIVVAIALFFLVFSFVRTALVALLAYLIMYWLLRRLKSPALLFFGALLGAVVVNLATALAPQILEQLQQVPVISRLFLRGETGLDASEIYVQLFRPWVWGQHFQMFESSPYWMGQGTFDFNELKSETLVGPREWSDAVALPTRLLAAYGLPTLLLFGFMLVQLARRAQERDVWACAVFAPLALIAMQWGSIFYPADPMFMIYMLMVVAGARAYR